MTQIIGGHNTGLLDGSFSLLNRNDPTGAGTIGHNVLAYVNASNGNLVFQERDAYLPSLGLDFDLVRTYNSRGHFGDLANSWSLSTAVRFEQHTDQLAAGGVVKNYSITYGDGSNLHFSFDAASNTWISTDAPGAYEVLRELPSGQSDGAVVAVTRGDQSVYRFDKSCNLVSITDPNGVTMSFSYSSGKLSKVKDDTGHTISFNYASGHLASITKTSATDSSSVTLVQYGYSGNLLTQVTDRLGLVTKYSYDPNGLLVGVSLPNQQVVNGKTQTYDSRSISFTYKKISWADTPHTNTPFEQGEDYVLTQMTDAAGGITTLDYAFLFGSSPAAGDRDLAFKPTGARDYQGGSTRVVDALGNARAYSNATEFVAWRQANGYYATYKSGTSPQSQIDAIRNPQSVVYTYDPNSQITQVVDQQGFKTTYGYDAQGNLAQIVERNGYAAIARDDQGTGDGYYRKLRVDLGFADQPISWFTAQSNWNTVKAQILAKFTTSFTYDARGNQLSSTDGSGNQTTFTFTSFNKVATITSAMGNALATSDDASVQAKRVELGYAATVAGLSSAQKSALQALYTTSFTYDSKQNLTQRTDPGGDVTTYTYDANGNLLTRTATVPAAGANAAISEVTTYGYDAYGNNVTVKDAEGNLTTNLFDTFGNLLSSVDPRGGVTTYTYDKDNRLQTTQTPEGRLTTNAYDPVGNRIAVTDYAGHTVTQVYDKNNLLISTLDPALSGTPGNRTTASTYDVLGNVTKVTDAEGRVTTYSYDSRRLLVTANTPQVLKADGTSTSYRTSYAYDGQGNVVTLVDNNGNTTQTLYNNLGLTRRITDAIGNVTEYVYDANLQQLQITIGAQLPAGQRRVLKYGYDEENQLVSETDALGNKRSSIYDAVGNVVAVKDENGNTTNYQFDRDNRLIKETKPGALNPVTGTATVYTVLHQYDGSGNEIQTTDEDGGVTKMSFDKDGRRVLVVDPNGINTVFEYDSRNNTTKIAIGVAATYSSSTRHVTITDATHGQVETFKYDEFNQLVAKTDGVGNALVTSDDAVYKTMRTQLGKSSLVAGLSAADKTALLAQYSDSYAYDRVGNRTSQTDHLGRVTLFVYDGLDRLQSRTDPSARTISYRYDGNDNRVKTVDPAGRTAIYAFDAADRIISTTDALGTVTSTTYDNVGNKLTETLAAGTADARTTSFVYDLGDRLRSQTSPEGRKTSYTYDAIGNRLSVKTADGTAVAETTQYVYDALNRNIRVIDALGFVTRFTYDGKGDTLSIVDAKGGVRALQYDAGGRRIQLTDAVGRVTRYAYDTMGNAVSVTTAFGLPEAETTTFAYDAEGNLRSVTDAAGKVSSSGYDAVYNLTSATDANGHTTKTAYDALNRVITVTDAAGGITRYTYDAVDNKLSETDALGRVRSFAYDASDRLIVETDALNVKRIYAYDRVGNTVSITEAANFPAFARTTTFVYDDDDNLVQQTDALGGTTTTTYDANNNATAVTDANGHTTSYAYDADNRVTSITDPLGLVTTYTYDGNGNRVRVTDPLGARTTFYFNANNELVRTIDALGFTSTTAYDGNGNVVTRTSYANAVAIPADPLAAPPTVPVNANDQSTRYVYDKLNRLMQQTSLQGLTHGYGYDAVGNLVSDTDENNHTTTFAYDAIDRRTNATDPLGNSRTTTYDAVGNVLTQTDELGRVTTFTYDAENRLLTSKDPLGGISSFTYDVLGNRITSKDELGRTTQFKYDADNRLIQQIDPLLKTSSTTYDAVGNKLSVTDENGHTTSFAYDADDRQISQTDALGKTSTSSYDAAGNQTSQTDENGHTTSFAYDLDGQLTSQTNPLGGVHRYTYDAFGNKKTDTDENGKTTNFFYDRDNRLVTQTDPLGKTRSYGYDAVGNLTRLTDENGHSTTYAYDALNRQITQTDPLGQTRISTYDKVGNKLSDTDENGNTTSYAYDALDRLTTRTDALGGVRSYTYDAVGNRLSETDERGKTNRFTYDADDRIVTQTDGLGGSKTFTYDAVGNKKTETNELGRVTTFTYDADDRLLSQVDPLGHSRFLTYDDAGNIKTQTDENGQVVTFTYDANDRLVTQQNPIGTLRYTYDAVGNKLSDTDENGNTTTYAYDAVNRLLGQTDPLGGITRYTYDAVGNRLSETDPNGHSATYVYDVDDRVVTLTDGEGYQTNIDYDAVGNVVRRELQLDLNDPSKTAVTVEAYDALNRVIGTLTGDGHLILYAYDAAGNLISKTEYDGQYTLPANLRTRAAATGRAAIVVPTLPTPAAGDTGRKTTYTYDDGGRLTGCKTPDGVTTTYGYDAAGNRTSEKQADGTGAAVTKRYGYDSANRVTDTTDAMGVVTHLVLDQRGNILEKHEAYGTAAERVTKYTYDGNNRVTQQTDALGIVTAYTYNAAGDMTSRARAGRTERFEYDRNHRLTAQVDGEGERTEYKYDGAGNRIEVDAGIVGGQPAQRVQKYEYNASDQLTAEVDGNGVRTEYVYDGAGNRVEMIQNAGAAPAGQRHTFYAYDADNRLTQLTDARGGVTTYAYDALGNQTQITGPTGSVTTSTFDKNGRVLTNIVGANGPHGGIKTTNVYDARGNLVQTTVQYADGSDTARTTKYTYDALDRQTAITDAEGFTVQYTYDAFGNQTSVTTGLYLLNVGDAGYDAAKAARAHRSETDFAYDALDRLTDTTQNFSSAAGDESTLHATYDAFGNRLTQTTGFGTAEARTVKFFYDDADRLVRRETPAGGVVTLEYDAVGNQIAKHTLQRGTENTAGAVWLDQFFEYDDNGQATAERDKLNNTTTVRTEHHFDAFGNEIETVLAKGTADERTTRYAYNANNDLISQTDAYGTPEARTTQYGIDAAGQTVKETDPLGRVTRFYFDAAGRQTGTLDPLGYLTTFDVDSQGNVTKNTVYMHRYVDATPGQYDGAAPTPDGNEDPRVITNTYDGNNNLVRQVLADGTRTDYLRDGNGKLLEQTNFGSSDATLLARTANGAARVLSFTYDDAGRLTHFVNADGSVEDYDYDTANNKISETISNPQSLPGGRTDPTRTTTFAYDGDNRLITQTFDPSGLNQVQSLAYDKAGNAVSKTDANGNTTTSVYDVFGRLTSLTDALGGTTSFGYDLVGNQISSTDPNGKTTNRTYDHLDQVVKVQLPAVTVFTIDGGTQTNVRPTTTTTYDAIGNIVETVDANGYETTRWYDANDNVIAELSGDNVLRTATFDATGSPLTTTLYMTRLADSAHNPAVLPGAPTGDSRTNSFEYDKGRRITRTVFPSAAITTISNTASGDSPTVTTTNVATEARSYYDAFGNLVESVDQNGGHAFGYYDALGRQVASVDAAGFLIETAYDDQGNVVRQTKYATALSGVTAGTRPTAPGGAAAVVDRVYDAANRLVDEYSPTVQLDGSTASVRTHYDYDDTGRMTSRTLAFGSADAQTEYYWYDANGREIAVVNAARTLHRFAYDANGNKTQQSRYDNPVPNAINLATASYAQVIAAVSADAANDEVSTITYDALGRVTSETQSVQSGGGNTTVTKSTAYDAMGNATKRTDGDGYSTQVDYDALGHATRTITPDGTSSFIEYDAAGAKVRAWTGVLGANSAQAATGLSASIGSTLDIAWHVPGTGSNSFVVFGTASHPDADFAGTTPGSVYASTSSLGGSGDVSTSINLAQFSAGTRVYFRVVTVDGSGNQAWTDERSVLVPARLTGLSSQQSGTNVIVTATFSGAVTAPTLKYGATNGVPNTATPSSSSGNTYTFTVPAAQAGFYALQWTASGSSFTTAAAPFGATGPHLYDAASGEVNWTLPATLAAQQQVNPSQIVLIDGLALGNGYTFGGTLHFKPGLTGNGSVSFDVLYGSSLSSGHTVSVVNRDVQTRTETDSTTVDGNGDVNSATRVFTYDHGYRSDVSVTLTAGEAAGVTGTVHVAYRTAGSGTDFTGDTALSASGNTWSGSIALNPGTYDLKVWYTDASSHQVVVEWQRVTVAATTLPATVTQTDNTDPYVFDGFAAPPAAGNFATTLTYTGNSLQVLATETDGVLTKSGSTVTATPGAYAGPLDATAASFSLGLTTTAGTNGGTRATNGLLSQTYFTAIEYNALGAKIGSNEDDGLWRRYGVDANGNKVQTQLYGTKADEQAHLATPGETAHAAIVTFSAFDKRNLEIAKFGAAVIVDGGQTHRAVTRSTYDYAGRLATQLGPNPGAVTQVFGYDAAGNRISQTDELGNLTTYAYDRLGHVVLVTDPNGHTRRRTYDGGGRMSSEIDGFGKSTTYAYDAFDRVTVRTDAEGNQTQYAYDRLDRLITLTDALNHDTDYAYDKRDNRTGITDVNGNVTTQAYDSLGRVSSSSISTAIVSGGATVTETTSYTYDAYNNRTSETDPEGRTRFYAYGAFGRLSQITDEGGRATNFGVDRFGRTVSETNATTGRNIVRAYNDAGSLVSVTDNGPDAVKSSTTYTYDVAGHRKHETVTVTSGGTTSTGRNQTYTYDGAGRLTRWDDATSGLELNYAWDAAGNQVRVYTDDQSTNHTYAYDADDRVTSVKQGTTTIASYTYDDAGNRLTYNNGSATAHYSYDALNRVTQSDNGSGKKFADWSYDNLGNVLLYRDYDSDGTTVVHRNTNTYFASGLTKTSHTETTKDVSDDDKKKDQTTTSTYDKSGRQTVQVLVDSTDSSNVSTYTYTFSYTADGRQTSVSASGANDAKGSSTSTYDSNDHLILLDKGKGDGADSNETLSLTYDNEGHILTRLHDDGKNGNTNPKTTFFYANGNPVGETGTNTSGATVTLLDVNGTSGDGESMQYNPLVDIGKDYPGSSTSTYTTRLGDNLQSVAAAVYGNPSLWYLIADANGLTGSESLKAGQSLQIPTTVQTGRLNADTHVLYKESDIIGSKLPNLKTPEQSKDNCALIGAIILIVLTAIVAIVLTIVTAGIAAPAAVALLGLEAGSIAAIVTTVAVTAVIGGVVGFAASVATQGILVGFGLQKEFDWKQVAADTVVGFISGAVSGLGEALQLVKIASTVAKVANVAAQAALEAAGEVARQAIANDGHIDNPWTILAAGAGGAFGALASRAVRTEQQIARGTGALLERGVVEVGPAANRVKVVRTVLNATKFAQAEEGASVFKTATTKFVKAIDESGKPVLQQVERSAFQGSQPKTILKLADTKLVKIGNDISEVPRISAQFSVAQRIGRRLSSFADSALTAIKSVPGKIAGAASTAATKVGEFASAAVSAVKTLPAKASDAFEATKDVARLIGRTVSTGVKNFVAAAGSAVRAVGRAISELPGAIAKTATEAADGARAAIKAVRTGLSSFATTALEAVKSLPGKVKNGVADLVQTIKEAIQAGTVSKGATTKIVRTFEDSPAGRVAKLTEVARESFTKKGFKTIVKADTSPLLEDGTKLVRVGDDIQTWRSVSSQYTVSQRINRYLANKTGLSALAGDEFKVGKTIEKFADTKIVRTGFVRQFNEATQTFEEVAVYATRRRLVADGLDKTTRFVQAVKSAKDAAVAALSQAASTALDAVRKAGKSIAALPGKAYDLAAGGLRKAGDFLTSDTVKATAKLFAVKGLDAVRAALPLTKATALKFFGGLAFTFGTAALRDYKDDRAGGSVATLIFIGKYTAFSALRRPRDELNNYLWHEELSRTGSTDTVSLAITNVRATLGGFEKKHGWWPLSWIATGTNVLSRVQSPIDLDYNARYDQQLRASQLTSGQTARFDPRSVFDFENSVDGRVVDQKIPLLQLSNLPPLPSAA